MAVEQVRPDQRPEKWFGSRRKILTSAQGLRFFPKPPAALLILLFQSHAMSEMRGCLRWEYPAGTGSPLRITRGQVGSPGRPKDSSGGSGVLAACPTAMMTAI